MASAISEKQKKLEKLERDMQAQYEAQYQQQLLEAEQQLEQQLQERLFEKEREVQENLSKEFENKWEEQRRLSVTEIEKGRVEVEVGKEGVKFFRGGLRIKLYMVT